MEHHFKNRISMSFFKSVKRRLISIYYDTFLGFKDHFFEIYYSVKSMPYLEKLTDERKNLEKEIKLVQDYQFPFYQYPQLNHHFLKYLISTKEPRDAAFNKSNLMIVLGPENIGKSLFVKYNLKSFESMDLKPKPFVSFFFF